MLCGGGGGGGVCFAPFTYVVSGGMGGLRKKGRKKTKKQTPKHPRGNVRRRGGAGGDGQGKTVGGQM